MEKLKKRFMAFWVDIGISTGIIIILFVVFGLTKVIAIIIGATVAAILFLLKDITGRSVGKRIFKLKIIDRMDKTATIPVKKLILRNILLGLWMVDGFMLYENRVKYKIMDKVLGLDVVTEEEGNYTVVRDKLDRK